MKVRKVRLSDRERMIEITRSIWDGHDYMPRVFEEWVKEKEGMFIAAVDENDSMVGFQKLTMVTPHDTWIEGLRKDLKSDVKGVGRFLTEYMFSRLAQFKGLKSIRFATYIYNVESIGLFKKMGFKLLQQRDYKSLTLPKIGFIPEYKGNRTQVLKDTDAVFEFVKRSRWKKYSKGGLCHSWVVKPVTYDNIYNDYVSAGNAFGIIRDGKIKAAALINIREKGDITIVLFEGENEKYRLELFRKIKQRAYEENCETVSIVIAQDDRLSHKFFKERGFKSWETEGDFHLYDFAVKDLKKYEYKHKQFKTGRK